MKKTIIALLTATISAIALAGSLDHNQTCVFKMRKVCWMPSMYWRWEPSGSDMVCRTQVWSEDNKGIQQQFIAVNTDTSMVVYTECEIDWADFAAALEAQTNNTEAAEEIVIQAWLNEVEGE